MKNCSNLKKKMKRRSTTDSSTFSRTCLFPRCFQQTISNTTWSNSDGQLLCLAYNTSLRSSSRPFGFIPKDQIWDLTSVVRSDSLPPTTPPTPLRPVSSLGLSASTTPTRPNSSLGYSSTSPNARPGSSLGILTTPSRPHSSTGIAFSTPMRRDLSSSSSSSGVSDATTAATSVGMSRGESANEKSEKERVGMTFRRVENLKIWAGFVLFLSTLLRSKLTRCCCFQCS